MIISITGFMGCGKSSTGRKLSELLCCPFIDLDAFIEEKEGRTIPEIFSSCGEESFRSLELAALKEIIEGHQDSDTIVLALGGGTIMTPECADIVKSLTFCIYLRTSVNQLLRRLSGETAGRPMLSSDNLRTRIEFLMSERAETYENTASLTIDTDELSITETALAIRATLFI